MRKTDKYAGASVEDVKFLIMALQPVIAILLGVNAFERVAKIKMGLLK